MKTKMLLFLTALTCLAVSEARADTVAITFDNPTQTGNPGDTLTFFGTILNSGTSTVFLNSDDLNLAGASFNTTDLFFGNVPISLDSGASSGDIELFDVTLLSSFTDSFGPYGGTYTLFGGVDGNAQDLLTQDNFTVTATAPVATPEPATALLLATGLLGLGCLRYRKIVQG